MKQIVSIIYVLVAKCGGLGLLVFGVLDSSFLFTPFGNDLLLIGLTVSHPNRMPYYAAMATAGSVLGCSIVDWISRKGGERGLSRILPDYQIEYVTRHIQKSAAWSLAIASIMPPPFPFTAFVAAAAAFQYPRRKLLTVIAAARFVRFFLVGISAIMFGKSILQIAYGPVVRYLVIALFIATILGSVISVRARIKAIRFRHAQDSQTAEGLA